MASPDPKRQQQEQQQQAPPEYSTADFFDKTPSVIPQDINWKNAPEIEEWLNNLKPKFFKYLEDNKFNASSSANLYTHHLLNYLTLYRGELVGHYLSEGAWETIFSALGPIGNMMRFAYTKDYQWKMKWMASPLNPNAIYYYLHALPTQKAFEVALMPVKGMVAILAHGGGPFTKASYYDYFEGQVKEKYFFTPLLRAIQASHILADGIDKFNGLTFDKSKHRSWIEQANSKFNQALEELKTAKKSNNKTEIKQARKNLKLLINQYDGFNRFYTDKAGKRQPISELPAWRRTVFGAAGTSRAILRKALGNTARRLRSTERDPISFILSLIAGAIWDFTIGLALNTIRVAALKTLNLIPGFAGLRAQLLEFMSSNRWLQAARIGGISGSAFLKGAVSPTTVASGYLGFQLGQALFPNSPMGIAWATGVSGGLGAFYNTALKLSSIPEAVNWTQAFQDLRMAANSETFARPYAQQILEQNYIRGGKAVFAKGYGLEGFSFRPGPFMRFAGWLNRNWLFRLPINGFAWRGFLLNYLPPEILSIKVLGIPLGGIVNWLPAIDYFWQIKGGLAKLITQPAWKIFGKTIPTPYFRIFSLQNPSSFMSNVVQKIRFQWLKIAYGEAIAPGVYAENWVTKTINVINNSFKAIKPWTTNFFNPGFFMGFGISQYLVGLGWNPIAAYIVGPVAGSIGWNLGAFALEKTFGVGAASMSRINAIGWTGYLIGSLLDLVIPGSQVWLGPLLSGGFIAADIFLALAGKSLVALFAQGLSFIVGIFSTTAAAAITASSAIAIWATVTSIAAVAGLTVFFAYTIYAGFWVPMMEEGKAGPESSNFQISNNCTQIGPNQYNCCSNFSVTENIFNTMHFLEHKTDIHDTYLSIDLTDPTKTTSASRNSAKLDYSDVGTTLQLDLLTPQQYAINYDPADPIIEGQQLANPVMLAYLSTPDKIRQNLKNLMATNQSVVYSMKPFWDMLVTLAKERGGVEHLVDEYNAQIDLLNEQKKLVDDLIDDIKKKDLTAAQTTAESYLDNEPMGPDPCPQGSDCPEEKRNLNQLYDSWKPTVERYINKIKSYQNQTSPNLDQFLTDLETELETLDEQIKILKQIRDLAQHAQGKMDDKDAARILELEKQGKFINYTNLPPEEQEEIWDLLSKYFKDVFTDTNFYFVPQGTHYQVCMDMTYTGTLPADPQTVCSTISYQPSIWGPNISFAKACTTFTPE